MEGKENKHQFVTTSPDSLNFGHGNHAVSRPFSFSNKEGSMGPHVLIGLRQCPGRFFASNEIKVVLIELLRSWDFRLKGDVEEKGGEEKRPESLVRDFSVTPNMVAEIEFRRRKE
jgi:hypothetical protein